jgi:hypothetical protein
MYRETLIEKLILIGYDEDDLTEMDTIDLQFVLDEFENRFI